MKERRHSRGRNRSYRDNKNGKKRHHGRRGRQGGRFNSGNQRERISVESGFLVLIDQFMLANQQFTEKLSSLVDADPAEKDALIEQFGGKVVELPPGLYRIDRDPYKMLIVVHPDGESPKLKDFESSEDSPSVFIDTRCVAMIDRELLDDYSLIEKYQSLWLSQQNKACRDLLRDNGGAVRYGFSRESDELEIATASEEHALVLRPRNYSSETAPVVEV